MTATRIDGKEVAGRILASVAERVRARTDAGLPPPQHAFEHVFRQFPLYLIDDLLADMRRGHNVFATVFVECGAMYRQDGPAEFRPVGETEAEYDHRRRDRQREQPVDRKR